MASWHFNPTTGKPGRCRAATKCRFQLSEEEHFSTAQAAASHYESLQSASSFPTVSKLPESPPLGEARVRAEKKGDHYHYQELWFSAEDGTPAIYAKVNLVTWGEIPDGTYGYRPGVVLCDIEVNPALKGSNYALSAIRKLQEEHGEQPVEFTGTFSDSGYRMFQKLKALGDQTGKPLVAIQQGESLREPREGTSYSFVEDWESEQAKYAL